MYNHKVSIIVPVYNVSQYIVKCLDSIYGQTYNNIELILVDDCGSDDSMTIIHDYLASHVSIDAHIISHKKTEACLLPETQAWKKPQENMFISWIVMIISLLIV